MLQLKISFSQNLSYTYIKYTKIKHKYEYLKVHNMQKIKKKKINKYAYAAHRSTSPTPLPYYLLHEPIIIVTLQYIYIPI